MCLAIHLTRIQELILEATQSIYNSKALARLQGMEVNYWANDIARDEMPGYKIKIWIQMIMTLRQIQQARKSSRMKFEIS